MRTVQEWVPGHWQTVQVGTYPSKPSISIGGVFNF
jgi:hypothetical protein